MEEVLVDEIVVLSLVLLYVLDLVTDLHDHDQCSLVFSSIGRACIFELSSSNFNPL